MSISFYEAHNIPTCPDGDKLRSDDEGLFCMVEGDRVPALLVNGSVVLQPVIVEPVVVAESRGKSKKDLTDGNG